MKPDYAFLSPTPPPLYSPSSLLPPSSSQGDCHMIAKKWHINEAPLQGSFLFMSPHKTIRWFEEGHGHNYLAYLPPSEGELLSPAPIQLLLRKGAYF